MTKMLKRRLVWRFMIEAFAWLIPAIAFLTAYITHFGNNPTVIAPHLFIVAALWAGSIGLRMLATGLMGARCWTPYCAVALAFTPWIILMIWYVMALVGLSSWGRVTTLPILKTYAGQYPFLLDSLGLPGWLVWAPPMLLIAAVVLLGISPLMRPDWSRALLDATTRGKAMILALMLAMLPGILFAMIHLTEPLHTEEPIELSLYPQLGALKESTSFSSSPAVNSAESDVWRTYTAVSARRSRNVILIVGDALRADHMGIYGYHRDTTPYLSSLAKEGTLQAVAGTRAVCSESMCGFMAMAASRPIHTMPTKPFTLHQALRRNGYTVRMVLSGDHTNFYGLRDLYGEVDSYVDGSSQPVGWGGDGESLVRYINDDQLVLDEVSRLPTANKTHPLMLQIVLMSTHGLGPRHPENIRFKPFFNYYAWFGKQVPELGPTERQAVVNFYDNGVYQFDHYIRLLLEQLRAKGYLDDAVVVITGDHGEMLGESNLVSHGQGVHEPTLHVPLLLGRFGYKAPSLPEHAITSQIDIAPTIMGELSISSPPSWEGLPLQSTRGARTAYFQQAAEAGIYEQGIDGRVHKYWHDFGTDKDFVFDITRDPGEKRNLARQVSEERLAYWRAKVAHGGLQVGRNDAVSIVVPLFKPESLPPAQPD